MAYLDNTVITVDAVLTKKGRERLGQGRHAFNIAKFAVSDDEIDYSLYNTAHPLGNNYFSNIIESMPVLEAIPDESQTMMYKLLTLEGGSDHPRMPYMSGVLSSYILSAGEKIAGSTPNVEIKPVTTHWDRSGTNQIGTLDVTAGYTMILFNENSVTVLPTGVNLADQVTRVDSTATTGTDPMINLSTSAVYIGTSFFLDPKSLSAIVDTKFTIYGNESGVTATATLTVHPS